MARAWGAAAQQHLGCGVWCVSACVVQSARVHEQGNGAYACAEMGGFKWQRLTCGPWLHQLGPRRHVAPVAQATTATCRLKAMAGSLSRGKDNVILIRSAPKNIEEDVGTAKTGSRSTLVLPFRATSQLTSNMKIIFHTRALLATGSRPGNRAGETSQ